MQFDQVSDHFKFILNNTIFKYLIVVDNLVNNFSIFKNKTIISVLDQYSYNGETILLIMIFIFLGYSITFRAAIVNGKAV